jgi:hypothetical protein
MKVNGTLSDFAAVRTEGTQIVISYGLKQVEGDLYEWHEVSLNKTSTNALTIDIVKTAILGDINHRTDEKILSGLVWKGNPVWLSQENQFNFKAAYDLAVQTQGATLPVTFKLGEQEDGTPVYHTFETMEDFTDFYISSVNFINQTLNEGWARKDSIDWSPYEPNE